VLSGASLVNCEGAAWPEAGRWCETRV